MTEKKAILIYPDVSCLDKTNKNLDEKKYTFDFVSVGVRAVLRFLVNVKNLG